MPYDRIHENGIINNGDNFLIEKVVPSEPDKAAHINIAVVIGKGSDKHAIVFTASQEKGTIEPTLKVKYADAAGMTPLNSGDASAQFFAEHGIMEKFVTVRNLDNQSVPDWVKDNQDWLKQVESKLREIATKNSSVLSKGTQGGPEAHKMMLRASFRPVADVLQANVEKAEGVAR